MDIPQIQAANCAEVGEQGQQYLATGKNVALRRWVEKAGEGCGLRTSEYETVGIVLKGKVELTLGDEKAMLEAGQSWLVPAGAQHAYRVIEDIDVIEATSPPERFTNHG